MKFKLLSILIVLTLPLAAMQKSEGDVIEELLETVEQRLPGIQKKAVVVLGPTDSGKSTLINYLNDLDLVWASPSPHSAACIMLVEEEVPYACPIGQTISHSQTFYPQMQNHYCDCPGFGDTREFQDIVNAYSIYKVLTDTEKVKIVLTVSVSHLFNDKAQKFLGAIKKIGTIFENEIDKLLGGLCLVITKKTEYHTEIELQLGRILMEQRHNLTSNGGGSLNLNDSHIKILEVLADFSNNRVSFFNHPKEEGLISKRDKEPILKSISGINYITDLNPTLSFSRESQLSMRNCFSQFTSSLSNIVNDVEKNYPEYCLDFIKSYSKHTALELREEFKTIGQYLENLSAMKGEFIENAQNISLILEILACKGWKEFSANLKRLKILKALDDGIDKGQYPLLLPNFKRDISVFGKVHSKSVGNTFKLKGWIVGISDLEEALQAWGGPLSDISQINVYSLNSLLIDQDITAPGINMVLYAPYWRIMGKRKITLRGTNGPDHSFRKNQNRNAQSLDGVDGLPGKPGLSGGHFYGKGKEFHGGKNLTLDISGGKGGRGQDGGDGEKGLDGQKGDKGEVEIRDQNCCVPINDLGNLYKVFSCFLYYVMPIITWGNRGVIKIYQSGQLGEPGGNGGRGGLGGYGGRVGAVTIENYNGKKVSNYNLIADKIEDGADGNSGKPGKGGNHGAVYRGVYLEIKKWAFYEWLIDTFFNNFINKNKKQKYGFMGKVLKKLIGIGSWADILEYSKKGIVPLTVCCVEYLKNYCAWQWGGICGSAIVPICSIASWKAEGWLEAPCLQQNGERARKGNKAISHNKEGLVPPEPNPPINISEATNSYKLYESRNKGNNFVGS